jgi:hypothetical protein
MLARPRPQVAQLARRACFGSPATAAISLRSRCAARRAPPVDTATAIRVDAMHGRQDQAAEL